MRRIALLLVVAAAACRQEHPAARPGATPTTTTLAPSPHSAAGPVQSTAPPPVRKARSTPQQCSGDGSYEQAVECLRIAATLDFTSSLGNGRLTRSTIGAERLTIHAADGNWTAEPRPNGIVWTHDNQHTTRVPQPLERLYQRLTIFPDPQKKEGGARLAATEGETKRYEFTDANNADRYVVWVSATDGHMAKVQIGALTIGFS